MSEIEKKNKKGKTLTRALTWRSSPPSGPSELAGPAHHLHFVVFHPLAPKQLGGECRRRPGHLLLATEAPLTRSEMPRSPLCLSPRSLLSVDLFPLLCFLF